jgi:hypothetical protein
VNVKIDGAIRRIVSVEASTAVERIHRIDPGCRGFWIVVEVHNPVIECVGTNLGGDDNVQELLQVSDRREFDPGDLGSSSDMIVRMLAIQSSRINGAMNSWTSLAPAWG